MVAYQSHPVVDAVVAYQSHPVVDAVVAYQSHPAVDAVVAYQSSVLKTLSAQRCNACCKTRKIALMTGLTALMTGLTDALSVLLGDCKLRVRYIVRANTAHSRVCMHVHIHVYGFMHIYTPCWCVNNAVRGSGRVPDAGGAPCSR